MGLVALCNWNPTRRLLHSVFSALGRTLVRRPAASSDLVGMGRGRRRSTEEGVGYAPIIWEKPILSAIVSAICIYGAVFFHQKPAGIARDPVYYNEG